MGPSTSPILPLTLPAGTLPESLETGQFPGEMAENVSGGATGLFALLLNQLTIEEPAVQPVTPEIQSVIAGLTSETADQLLPSAGNALPQFLETVAAGEEPLLINGQLTKDVVAATAEQSESLALPGVPLPAPIKTMAIPAGSNSAPGPAPLTVATPASAQPQKAVTPVPVLQHLSQPAEPAPVLADDAMANALARQSSTRQPVPTVDGELFATLASTSSNGLQPSAAPLATTPLATTTQHVYTLNHPVADVRWGDSLGQRIMWMTDNGIGRAEIRLNPPELGPLEVRIAVANDEARVAFTVQHGTTREALESAMPRLREMFAQQGIELTDSSVSQQSPDDRRADGDSGPWAHDAIHSDAVATVTEDGAAISDGLAQIHEGLIDTYV